MTQKLDEVLNNYIDALASQSWDAASVFFHEKATVIFAEGTYHGKSSIGAAISKTFSMIKDEFFDIRDIRWNLQTDQFASCTFCFKWEGTLNGNRFTNPGRGTLVWVNENGQWLIINEHFGPIPR
ncbi:MAG: hypothetical protein CVV41_11920 [Candidatus Riflebacteria bacterium HGW-Riflebacteria-1]|jgi:ketosteroid isomerase-like protein|nr:MAG: hypothetical protein CVV41_11920 [Candidatus Riflebacteria bacterium HGW-Riflebacteria-1]